MFDSKNEEIYDEELINILFLENEEEYIKKIKEISENMTLYTAEDENHKKLYKIFKYAEKLFYDVEKRKDFSNLEIRANKVFFVNRMRIIQRLCTLKGRKDSKMQIEMLEILIDSNIFDNKIYKEEFENYKNQAGEKFNQIEVHDKKIMETMGIFLSIFSVIGLGVSSVLNLENNHIATWLMICGTILITMSGLFNLINPDKFNKQEKKAENDKCKIEKFLKGVFNTLRKPIIIGVILILLGGVIRCKFPNHNEELVNKEKFEQVEKRVQNNENELLDKNLDYRNQIKDLKEEIKKLQSKVEKLEKKK